MASKFSAWSAALLLLALAPVLPAPAWACSVLADPERSASDRRRQARTAIEGAAAIVDGEVVRPFVRGRQSALVRAFRVLKGPQQPFFEVGERHNCDSALERVGERLRLVLAGGPDLYFVPYTGAAQRDVDRLLRSDRRRDWPYRAGTGTPAP